MPREQEAADSSPADSDQAGAAASSEIRAKRAAWALIVIAAVVFAADVWVASWFWRTLPEVGPLGWGWLACACASGLLLVPALAAIKLRPGLRQLTLSYGLVLLLGALHGFASYIIAFLQPFFLYLLWSCVGNLLWLVFFCWAWLRASLLSRRLETLGDRIWSTLVMSCVIASGLLLSGCLRFSLHLYWSLCNPRMSFYF